MHVPSLREGEEAIISWREMTGAAGYILERRWNEDFGAPEAVRHTWKSILERGRTWAEIEAYYFTWRNYKSLPEEYLTREGIVAPVTTGETWENIEMRGRTWAEIEADDFNWAENDCRASDFIIYDGSGEPVPAPAQGLTWDDMQINGDTWRAFGLRKKSWIELDSFFHMQLGAESWEAFEGRNLSWADSSSFLSRGMPWKDYKATYSTWADMATRAQSWEELENASDTSPHAAFTDFVPLGAKTGSYRLKGRNEFGETTYIGTTPVKVIPIFERDDEVVLSVREGEKYRIELDYTEMRTFQAGPLMDNRRIIRFRRAAGFPALHIATRCTLRMGARL